MKKEKIIWFIPTSDDVDLRDGQMAFVNGQIVVMQNGDVIAIATGLPDAPEDSEGYALTLDDEGNPDWTNIPETIDNAITDAVTPVSEALDALTTTVEGISTAVDTINSQIVVWNNVTGTSQAAAVNKGYIANNAALVTVTLPATAAVGDVIRVQGAGAGGWLIAQNASQTIIGNASTASTVGVGGSVASTDRYDSIELVCIVANTTFAVVNFKGVLTTV